MRIAITLALLAVGSIPTLAAEDISVERGRLISVLGGCHDCHTVGYNEAEGKIDETKALKGSAVGFQGPWGTTYPSNLRLTVRALSERGFFIYLQNVRTRPPMPWYNLRVLTESDASSLYRYIKALGEPGARPPHDVPPGEEAKTPFIVLAPPQMPSR